MDVLDKLKGMMTDRGWTEYRLAKECGLSESTIINMFKRNTNPSIPTLEIICKGFGITLSQFFAENDMVELSPELKKLFDGWLSLTVEQKETILQMITAFHKYSD